MGIVNEVIAKRTSFDNFTEANIVEHIIFKLNSYSNLIS